MSLRLFFITYIWGTDDGTVPDDSVIELALLCGSVAFQLKRSPRRLHAHPAFPGFIASSQWRGRPGSISMLSARDSLITLETHISASRLRSGCQCALQLKHLPYMHGSLFKLLTFNSSFSSRRTKLTFPSRVPECRRPCQRNRSAIPVSGQACRFRRIRSTSTFPIVSPPDPASRSKRSLLDRRRLTSH